MAKKIPCEVPEGMKYCFTCRSVHSLSDLDKRKSSPDGYFTRCRSCVKAKAAERERVRVVLEETYERATAPTAAQANYTPEDVQPYPERMPTAKILACLDRAARIRKKLGLRAEVPFGPTSPCWRSGFDTPEEALLAWKEAQAACDRFNAEVQADRLGE